MSSKRGKTISRRSFMQGTLVTGAAFAGLGLTGCAQDGQATNSGSNADVAGGVSNVTWTQEVDIVVVGGGPTGCAAALSGGEAGAKVILLEAAPVLGGCGALCVGSVTVPMTKLQTEQGTEDSLELYRADMEKKIGAENLKRAGDYWKLFDVFIASAGKTVDWLIDHDVAFNGPFEFIGHSANRMHMLYPDSSVWPTTLTPHMEAAGVDIKVSTKGIQLVTEGDRVIGVKAIDQMTDEEFYFKATKGVVLASASVDSSYDMKLKAYSADLAATDAANGFNDGYGIIMAQRVGADVTGFDDVAAPGIRCQAPSQDVGVYSKQGFMPFGFITAGAIMVNKEGKRYASEEINVTNQAIALKKNTDGYGWMVYDDAIAQNFQAIPTMVVSSMPGVGWGTVDDFVENGSIIKGDTLEEIAEKAGVDAQALVAEVERYNGFVAAGKDDDFGRKAFGIEDAGTLNKGINTPPYYIHGPQKGQINSGGLTLSINTEFQVLDTYKEPILGLYAGGILGLGLSYIGTMGHGANMGWAFTSGKLIGESLAAL